MEVAGIKEGALTVYSGQRLFPLTFQMPESGLALTERRWHASRKGGDVTLGSVSATELEVYTCGATTHEPFCAHDIMLVATKPFRARPCAPHCYGSHSSQSQICISIVCKNSRPCGRVPVTADACLQEGTSLGGAWLQGMLTSRRAAVTLTSES